MTPLSKDQASSSKSMHARGDGEQEGFVVDMRMSLLLCLVYIPCVFLQLLLVLIVALQFQRTVDLNDEDDTTTKDLRMGQMIGGGCQHNDLYILGPTREESRVLKSAAVDDDKVPSLQVDEDSLDFRQSLRTFEDKNDTSPSDSTYTIHEVELSAIQLLTQQQTLQDAHQSSPVTDERTSDVTGHVSQLDHIVLIHEDEPDAIQPLTQWQTSPDAYQRTSDVTDHTSPSDHLITINGIEHDVTQAQRRPPTLLDIHQSSLDERISNNGTNQMVPSNSTLLTNINNGQQHNPLLGLLSRFAPSTDFRIFVYEPNTALFFYAHVIIGALPFLLGLLHLILSIG